MRPYAHCHHGEQLRSRVSFLAMTLLRRWLSLGLSGRALLPWVSPLLACSADAPSPHCVAETCPTEPYFPLVAPNQACSPIPASERLDQALDVSLFWGSATDDETVVAQGTRLPRFFRPYRLDFHAVRPATDAGLTYAMTGSAARIDAALAQADIPQSGPLSKDQQHRAN